MNPTQKENCEELLTLAVDLLGDVIAQDIALLAGLLTRRDQECSHSSRVRA